MHPREQTKLGFLELKKLCGNENLSVNTRNIVQLKAIHAEYRLINNTRFALFVYNFAYMHLLYSKGWQAHVFC